jgi:hypothetical protein
VGVLIGGYGIEIVTVLPSAALSKYPSGSFVALIPLKPSQAESDYPAALAPIAALGGKTKDGGQGHASKLIPQQHHAFSEVAENSSDRGRPRLHQGAALSLPSSRQSVNRIGNSPEMKKAGPKAALP